jgi:hypothetical protein
MVHRSAHPTPPPRTAMSQTYTVVTTYLPTDLAAIAFAYFRPAGRVTTYILALHGNWEEATMSNYYNDALRGACEAGYSDLAREMITFGADDWGRGIWASCIGGHIDIAHDIINRAIATDGALRLAGNYSWDTLLETACHHDRPDFARLAIDHGATNWDSGLYGACKSGSMVCAELVIIGRPSAPTLADAPVKRGRGRPRRTTYAPPPSPTSATDWDCGMRGACAGNQPAMARFMISKGATSCACGRPLAAHLAQLET